MKKNEEGTFLNSTNDGVDPYDYHVLKSVENTLTKMRREENIFFNKGDDKQMPLEDEVELVGGIACE